MNEMFILFITFFQIGLFTFGGGHAMIPLITEQVSNHNWLSPEELTQLIAVSESTPGPFAINIATFIGSSQYGFGGAVLATIGVILPSFIIILLLATIFTTLSHNKLFQKIIRGVNPVIVGLIFSAGLYILYGNIITVNDTKITFDYVQIILFGGLFALNQLLGKKLHPILLIILAGVLGVVIYQFYTPPIITIG